MHDLRRPRDAPLPGGFFILARFIPQWSPDEDSKRARLASSERLSRDMAAMLPDKEAGVAV